MNATIRERFNPVTSSRGYRTTNGGPTMLAGDKVRLVTPENERLHGTEAVIVELTQWGAHCEAPAAETGKYRAVWEEMEALVQYVGECCAMCGSANLRWSGKCKVCENCGETGGCG